ncbi:MAG: hypothetical protein ACP5MT_01305 [Candidatus Acidifodinimicrobium sp.]
MVMKAQIFTLDLIIGLSLVISMISLSYYIFNYYLRYDLQVMSQNNRVLSVYSAFNSFLASNTTLYEFAEFENSQISQNTLNNYIISTLKVELGSPFSLTVYTNSSAGSTSVPNKEIYSFNSSGFNPGFGGTLTSSQLIAVFNPTTLAFVSFDLFVLKVDV